MKFGARIFKTGLAVILALYAAHLLGLEPAFFAGLTAGLTIQPSIYRTYQRILHQVQANFIGAALAVIFGLAFGHEPFVIGVVVMIAIAIILRLGLDSSTIPVTLVTIVIIMGQGPGQTPDDGYALFALSRFSLIMLGVFSAFLVNLFFLPPKYENKLYDEIFATTENAARWIRLITRQDTNVQARREDLEESHDKLVELDQLYLFYKEERNYFRNNKFAKARKLVLFREMLTATRQLIHVLGSLDKRENDFYHLPEHMQRLVQQQLDHLTNYHGRIMARYSGKVTTQMTDFMSEEADEGNESLTESFMNSYDYQELSREEWLNLLPLIAYIIEYNSQLDHLDRLLESYFTYHQEDEN
ncbi:aromatic acid exporter family protein [Salicibibacter halophilus]|uniref:Aromatic acid exporter family protein n=1 Tax=Salicibibacter halophilus TaxID=2502791 RepID=A0A514LLQ2_9BACI|nr:aromatic acid exporter family protein [Salicibibacter halophilus]QDI92756.1 aromatic acid exporter family protein [Salicibibacter halophilus]